MSAYRKSGFLRQSIAASRYSILRDIVFCHWLILDASDAISPILVPAKWGMNRMSFCIGSLLALKTPAKKAPP